METKKKKTTKPKQDVRYNYSKLRWLVQKRFGNDTAFAKALGISCPALSLKWNNRSPWKQTEMLTVANMLGFSISQIPEYFFILDNL